jgi:hypothetical protein
MKVYNEKKERCVEQGDWYEYISTYSGPIIPTKSLIKPGHFFFKSSRNMNINNKQNFMNIRLEKKILKNTTIINSKNTSTQVHECLQWKT